ncbi:CBN-SET-20 protein [Caenorhabditis brenneri]|uniref:CBN-SET-20 protein n=1 Tax=Caenorhabditis brenneri TaxID=135651 RepID=G0M6I4_CAEBE|nr:CBN-SET-20 protein [Caenorhabditis brenneri]
MAPHNNKTSKKHNTRNGGSGANIPTQPRKNKINNMNLRKRRNVAPANNQPKQRKPLFLSNAPVRKPKEQQELNKGRRTQGKMVDEWMRKRFPGREVKYVVRASRKDESWYKQAILHHKQRVEQMGNSFAAPFSEEQIDQAINVALNRMKEFAGYLKCNGGDAEAGRKWMKKTFEKATPSEIRKANEIIEKFDPFDTLSDPESKKTDFEVNAKCLVSIDTDKFLSMQSLSKDYFFDYIETNNTDMDSFKPEFRSAFRLLRKHKRNFRCKCTKDCDHNCPCYITNGLFTANVSDPFQRRRYTCSAKCGCQGKCSKSFPAPPPNNVKIVLDNEVKGCATYSTQYAGPSETVLEMRGVIRDEEEVDPQDEYAIQLYVVENDMDAIHEIFKSNKKLRAAQKVKALSDDYEKILEKLTNTNICLDPRRKGSEARYMSHSCFPNCRATMVYSEGLNPAKIRMMMTSLLPIYPGQELTFFYSLEYCCQQLADICLCKHLCCVKNVDLFPFITKKHIKIFYSKLYKKLHEEYLKKVAGKP